MLPTQPINVLYYQEARDEFDPRLYDLLATSAGTKTPLEDFDLETTDVAPVEEMASNPLMLSFLDLLVRISGARRVLEIGSFIGISTMTFARALPAGGKVIALEKFEVFADICRRNFERNGLADRIDLRQGDAAVLLDDLELDEPIDLAFIDGNKEKYLQYFTTIEPMVRPGGLILVDDILFQGDTLNDEPTTEKGRGVRAFLDHAAGKLDWHRASLPLSDGLMLLQKPAKS